MIELVDVVERESARCSRLLRSVDHALPVAHLPGWTVGHVGAHLAGDFRWATRVLTERGPIRSGLTSVRSRGPALCNRFDELAAAMVDALRVAASAPDEPCPNFAEPDGGRAAWWVRHQVHETVLHRWDLESADREPTSFDPTLAADGVDELLHVYTARYRPHRLAGTLVLRCEGPGSPSAAWTIRPGGAGGRVRVDRGGDPDPVAEVVTDPASLLLLLWRRTGLDDVRHPVRVDGDPSAVAAFLSGPVTA